MHIYVYICTYSCRSKVCLHVTFLQWVKWNIFLLLTSRVVKVTFVTDERFFHV